MTTGQEPIPGIISLRAEDRKRIAIEQAARHTGRTSEGFILDAAYREAQEILLDQVFFLLDSQSFSQFEEILANPPAPNANLLRLMATKAPWE